MIEYVVLPLLIFLIRVSDVSIGTLRIIFVSRGIRALSSVLGFFEVLIWLFAITQIMQNINSPVHYVAYAAGFGMGNFVGISIERKLSVGSSAVRIISRSHSLELVDTLRKAGYGVTVINGEGLKGPVKIIFTIVKTNRIRKVLKKIRKHDPRAFYSIEDVKHVKDADIPLPAKKRRGFLRHPGQFLAKKK